MAFKLNQSLGFHLNRAAARMRMALEDGLRAYGLTAPQWAVLQRLREEPDQSMAALGASLGFDKPTISGVVLRLRQKLLVTRGAADPDGRIVRVRLSSQGEQLVQALPPLAAQVNRRATRTLTAAQRQDLDRLLVQVLQNLE